MPTKLPPGCSIQWRIDPSKSIRLLDWLDQNPVERQVLFSAKRGPRTKSDCGIKAALAVFSVDENPLNRTFVHKEPAPFGQAILSEIRSLAKKYQAFNRTIGPVASRMSYDELQVGSGIHQKVERLLEQFPLWKRLHVYWRTLPDFNPYRIKSKLLPKSRINSKASGSVNLASDKASKVPSSKSLSMKKLKPNSRIASVDSDEIIIVKDFPTPQDTSSLDEGSESENDDLRLRRSKRNGKRSRDEFEEKEIPSQSSSKVAKDGIIADQRHELRMAEIQLKRQKLAFKAQERKTAAEIRHLELEAEERHGADERHREKERHEIILRLMGVENASGSKNKTPAKMQKDA